MVVAYLEKIRDKYIEEKININSSLNELLNQQKESVEIIKLLEQNNDSNFEAFTPRTLNSFNKMKIAELKEEQKNIDTYILELNDKLSNIEKEIEEVNIVINIVKEKMA